MLNNVFQIYHPNQEHGMKFHLVARLEHLYTWLQSSWNALDVLRKWTSMHLV